MGRKKPEKPEPLTTLTTLTTFLSKENRGGNLTIRKYPRHRMIKGSGPYNCRSRADGTILITPTWPQYKSWTEEGGGGPTMSSRMLLADALGALLNGVED